MTQDNHDGVITHQETNILEWEVKWALGSIPIYKASGGDSSWAISNPERWHCESAALNMPANMENSTVATGLEKVSFQPNPKERQCQRMFKLPHNCTHLTCWQSNAQNSPGQASTVHSRELPDVQVGFRKGRGTRDQIASICWLIEKTKEFQKNIYFCFIDYAKAFVWITTNCGKFFKKWELQTTWPASSEICMQAKKQQLEPDMEQSTGSKLEKKHMSRLYIVTLLI